MDDQRQTRLLIVDDDETLRESLANWLRRRGYDVETAPNAEAGLEHVGTQVFDLVITDVHLPGMNGLDFAIKLVAGRPLQKIVIVTGDPDEQIARTAIARSGFKYLLKPFEYAQLEAVVKEVLV
jgi:DNA-binding NtrC family response regulator